MACTERAWVLASARRVPLLLREGDGEELWDAALFDRCVDAAPTESASREGALADAQRHASAKRSDFTYGEVGSERFARCVGLARRLARSGSAATFVDVGCGAGRSLAAAAALASPAPFARLVGVELSPSLAAAARAVAAAALGDRETFILESDAVADARWAALRDAVFWINWLTWTTETRNDLARVAAAKLEPGAVVVTCGWALPGDRFALAFTFHADVCWGGTCVLFVHVAGDADRPATAATPRAAYGRGARLCRLVADGHAGAADTVPAGLCEDADAWLRLGVHGGEDPYDVVVDEASVFAAEGRGGGAVAARRAARARRRADALAAVVADGGYLLTRTPGAPALAGWRPVAAAAGAREGWAAVRPPRLAGRDARVRCTFDVTGKRQRPADIPAEKTHVRGIGKRGARQRLYECLTCCPDGIIEVCPACAASCHRGHDLRECDGALRGGDDDLAFCSCGFACACHTRCLP